MSEDRLYFAYGSNINLTQMRFRCPDAVPLFPVVLSGYELTYRGGGVATVIPKENSVVLGLLWKITPECEKALDHYEGYPNLYHKTDIAVTDPETGNIYYPMMYEMDARFKEPAVPSPFYFEGIKEGYLQNNMDIRPLMESRNRAYKEVKEYREKEPPWSLPGEWHVYTSKPKKKKDKER